jgi:hypothetical protein
MEVHEIDAGVAMEDAALDWSAGSSAWTCICDTGAFLYITAVGDEFACYLWEAR